jgi:hypothetical protein
LLYGLLDAVLFLSASEQKKSPLGEGALQRYLLSIKGIEDKGCLRPDLCIQRANFQKSAKAAQNKVKSPDLPVCQAANTRMTAPGVCATGVR